MNYPKVGVILINYQDYAKRFLADCRDSLRGLNYPKDQFVVYIVDNASTQETRAYLEKEYPEAIVICNQENAGWAGGNNAGIEQAFKDKCQDVVFLNIDTMVDKDWLKELVEAAYLEEKIGIVQSKILLHPVGADGQVKINSLGNEIHFLGFGFCRGYGEIEEDVIASDPPVGGERGDPMLQRDCFVTFVPRNDAFSDIPYASGAAMYVKGDLLKQIGLCDSEFFMYHDDLELSWRARLFGWRVVLAPRSIVWHKYQFFRSIKQIYFMERNRWLVLLYFYKWPTLVLLAPALLLFEIGTALYALKNHWLKTKLAVWAYFFHWQNLKRVWQKRKLIQDSRQINDRQMAANFTGKILFQEINNPFLEQIVNPIMDIYWQVVKKIMIW